MANWKTITLSTFFLALAIYVVWTADTSYYTYITVINNYYLQNYYYYYLSIISNYYQQILEYYYTQQIIAYYTRDVTYTITNTINNYFQTSYYYNWLNQLVYYTTNSFKTAGQTINQIVGEFSLAAQEVGNWILYGTTDTGTVLVKQIVSNPELVSVASSSIIYVGSDVSYYAVPNILYVFNLFGYSLNITTFIMDIIILTPIGVTGYLTKNKYILLFAATAIMMAAVWQFYIYSSPFQALINNIIDPLKTFITGITGGLL